MKCPGIGAMIAQSVQRLATGSTVWGSNLPIPVVARSKARVCGRRLARVTSSNLAVGMEVCVVSKDKRQNAKQSRQRTK